MTLKILKKEDEEFKQLQNIRNALILAMKIIKGVYDYVDEGMNPIGMVSNKKYQQCTNGFLPPSCLLCQFHQAQCSAD